MWWFSDFWNDYLKSWQQNWQDAMENAATPFSAEFPARFSELASLNPFAQFFQWPGNSFDANALPFAWWKEWSSLWQMPRIEAQLEPLNAFVGMPSGLSDMMRLSMRVFMPWENSPLEVQAVIGRSGEKMPLHEADVISEIAETQALPEATAAARHAKKS